VLVSTIIRKGEMAGSREEGSYRYFRRKEAGMESSVRNAHIIFLVQHIKKSDLSRVQKPCQVSRAVKQGTSYIPGKPIVITRSCILFVQQRPLEEQTMPTWPVLGRRLEAS